MKKKADSFDALISDIKKFNLDRDWDQFHNPKDIFIALISEIGELAEYYRWLSREEIEELKDDPSKKEKLEEEIADIFLYLIMLSYKSDIDIIKAIKHKIKKNETRYPISIIKGKHTNPLKGYKAK